MGEQPVTRGEINLTVTNDGNTEHFTREPDEHGEFTFEAITSGEAEVLARAYQHPVDAQSHRGRGEAAVLPPAHLNNGIRQKRISINLVDGETPWLDIDLAGGGTIQGLISGMGDTERAQILALSGDHALSALPADVASGLDTYTEGVAMAASDGVYGIEGLEAGFYTIVALIRDFTTNEERVATAYVEIAEGETYRVEIEAND